MVSRFRYCAAPSSRTTVRPSFERGSSRRSNSAGRFPVILEAQVMMRRRYCPGTGLVGPFAPTPPQPRIAHFHVGLAVEGMAAQFPAQPVFQATAEKSVGEYRPSGFDGDVHQEHVRPPGHQGLRKEVGPCRCWSACARGVPGRIEASHHIRPDPPVVKRAFRLFFRDLHDSLSGADSKAAGRFPLHDAKYGFDTGHNRKLQAQTQMRSNCLEI